MKRFIAYVLLIVSVLAVLCCNIIHCQDSQLLPEPGQEHELVLTEEQKLKIDNILVPGDVNDPAALGVDLYHPGTAFKYDQDETHVHHESTAKVKELMDNLVEKLHNIHMNNAREVSIANQTAIEARSKEQIAEMEKDAAIEDFRKKELNKAIMKLRMDRAIARWKEAVDYRIKVVKIFHGTIRTHNDHVIYMNKQKRLVETIHTLMCEMVSVQGAQGNCVSKQCPVGQVLSMNLAGEEKCMTPCPANQIYTRDWIQCTVQCPVSVTPTCEYGLTTTTYLYEGVSCQKEVCLAKPASL